MVMERWPFTLIQVGDLYDPVPGQLEIFKNKGSHAIIEPQRAWPPATPPLLIAGIFALLPRII